MKKNFFGLVAVVLAVGFSAFTVAHKTNYFVYGLDDTSTNYVRIQSSSVSTLPESNCSSGGSLNCIQGFVTDPNVQSYPVGTKTPDIQSSTQGQYIFE